MYLADSGLACHLLAIDNEKTLQSSPFRGPLFEGFVAAEILKHQANSGRRRELYCFRDQQGLEVDFVVPAGHSRLLLVEAKASHTALPAMAEPLRRLAPLIKGYKVQPFVIHRPLEQSTAMRALSPGVQAGGVADLLDALPQ